MIDLLKLYNEGYRRFKFSDGVVREVISAIDDHALLFSVPLPRDKTEQTHIWYYEDGRANIDPLKFVHVIGPADSVSTVPEIVNLKRDDDGRWWLEVPLSATVEDIQRAQDALGGK